MLNVAKGTRVYVAGCGGMLGQAVYDELAARGAVIRATDIVLPDPWLALADVTDFALMRRELTGFAPELVLNLAAMTDLEECEREPERAWRTNGEAAENLGRIAASLDVPYVLISTAGMFDGLKDVYDDDEPPAPISVYAKSKVHAESAVAATVPMHYILRAGWMMGGGPRKDKKFINKLFRQIQAGARVLHVVEDKLGTPTYTVDFARGLFHVAESGQFGLYNQVCEGQANRRLVAERFLEYLGLAGQIELKVVPSDYFSGEFFAPRPASEQLVNRKLNERGLNRMRHWDVCLAEYSRQFAAELGKPR
ncbi:SDR family oxidoreductase [Usitatibacter palustris]|uniref:dTDP-4-dehydrorhamnose reductase n=1 Tax=Usitatibacter palustris TaxID=2732487 RepID=A0A6M4H9Y3_9PROT|nr:sugar nucleotide-binding protein [Usitatibacter palustris]QJR15678.1 dTDP-4-dehydrorhamnose reductase [Usitatibacter palustris]